MKQDPFQPISLLCAQWKKKLASKRVDDLSTDEKKALNEHLISCLACTRVQAEYKAMDDAINHLPPVQPLACLPNELVALMEKQQRKDSMYNNEISKAADSVISPAFIQKRKTQKGAMDAQFNDRSSSRWAQAVSSLAAVLVVSLIVGAAFVLFSHKPGSGHTIAGSGITAVSSTSIPATAHTVLYTNLETKKANIYAVDPRNGSVFWKVTLPTKLTTSNLTSYQGLLFAPGYDGNLYALSATNGAIAWKYSVKDDPSQKVAPGTNIPSSPIVNGNVVYFGAGSGFYAINIHTGKLLWYVKENCKTTQVNQQGNTIIVQSDPSCNLVLGTVANGRVYAYFGGLYVLDAQTGNELWHDKRFQFAGPESIAVVDDNVYVYSSEPNSLFILNASTGSEKTKALGTSNLGLGGIMAADGVVYYNSGQELLALHGTQILWTQNYRLMDLLAGSNGTLFISSMHPLEGTPQVRGEQGTYFYALDAKTGAIKWHWGEKGDSWGPGSLLSFDGKLYFVIWMQQGNKWTDIQALWVLHNGQRDMFPIKES